MVWEGALHGVLTHCWFLGHWGAMMMAGLLDFME